ncbi:hypothetical protein JCM8547_003118 [Rhodosporidiobolus lusitaniae]
MASRTLCLDLPAFAKLNLESVGSPAPWTTLVSPAAVDSPDENGSSTPLLSLRHRVLLAALASLSDALSSASEQSAILSDALARAQASYDKRRLAVASAKETVFATSRAAQKAHSEAKKVEKLNGVFKEGADRSVKALERAVGRLLRRKAKGKAVEQLVPLDFVEELIVDLDLEEHQVLSAVEREAAAGVELGEQWRMLEEDLVRTLAAKVAQGASARLENGGVLGEEHESEGKEEEGHGVDNISLPPTPPASVHSFDLSRDDRDLSPSPSPSPSPSSDAVDLPLSDDPVDAALSASLTPLVRPVLLLLFHLHRNLATLLTSSVDTFESLVRASSKAVDAHRISQQKATKAGAKLRDLLDLQQREDEEWERVMEELRTTTVELARLMLDRPNETVVVEVPVVEGAGENVDEDG